MKKRIISAIVALIVVIPLVLIGDIWFKIGLGIISILGFYEIISAFEKEKKIPLLIKIISIIIYIFMIVGVSNSKNFNINIISVLVPILLYLIPTLFYKEKYNVSDSFKLLGITCLLAFSFGSLVFIREYSLSYFIYLLLITIMCDTFAHFIGTQIGKYKLCPKISPDKTIEGFIGGIIFSTFISTCYFTTFNVNFSLVKIIAITIFLSLMAVYGDLLFSLIKRRVQIKDFGNIMPGHGGILDRVDSILITSVAFTIIMYFM